MSDAQPSTASNKRSVYLRWYKMMSRCYDPKTKHYNRYGGRGIKVCERWHAYQNYAVDIPPVPKGYSIDRIDNDGDYCPENIRVADQKTQMNNTSVTVKVEHDGEIKHLQKLSEDTGVSRGLIYHRLKRGMSVEDAIKPEKIKAPLAITIEGETDNLVQWANKKEIARTTVVGRMSRGMNAQEALSLPVPERTKLTLQGVSKYVHEWAEFLKVEASTLRARLDRGWSDVATLTTPIDHHEGSNTPLVIEWKGSTKTVREWSEETGIPASNIVERIYRGWTVDKTLSTSVTPKPGCGTPKVITHNGVSKTVPEWARELGINPKTLHTRLSTGWTVERALSK